MTEKSLRALMIASDLMIHETEGSGDLDPLLLDVMARMVAAVLVSLPAATSGRSDPPVPLAPGPERAQ